MGLEGRGCGRCAASVVSRASLRLLPRPRMTSTVGGSLQLRRSRCTAAAQARDWLFTVSAKVDETGAGSLGRDAGVWQPVGDLQQGSVLVCFGF